MAVCPLQHCALLCTWPLNLTEATHLLPPQHARLLAYAATLEEGEHACQTRSAAVECATLRGAVERIGLPAFLSLAPRQSAHSSVTRSRLSGVLFARWQQLVGVEEMLLLQPV